jgi:hypothetical protein
MQKKKLLMTFGTTYVHLEVQLILVILIAFYDYFLQPSLFRDGGDDDGYYWLPGYVVRQRGISVFEPPGASVFRVDLFLKMPTAD